MKCKACNSCHGCQLHHLFKCVRCKHVRPFTMGCDGDFFDVCTECRDILTRRPVATWESGDLGYFADGRPDFRKETP